MITHLQAYRNGEFVKQIPIHNLVKAQRSAVIKNFMNEIERAAYANPHNTYWVDFKSIKTK